MGHRHNRKRTRSRHRRAHSAGASNTGSPHDSSCPSPQPYPNEPPRLRRDMRQLIDQPDCYFTMNAPLIPRSLQARANAQSHSNIFRCPHSQTHTHTHTHTYNRNAIGSRRSSSVPTLGFISAATERRSRDRQFQWTTPSSLDIQSRYMTLTKTSASEEDKLRDELSLCPGAETVVRFLFDGKVDFVDAPSGA